LTLKELELKPEYRSLMDNIAKDFIVPALRESIGYWRAVGFFSSTALLEISKGLGDFVKKGGKIQLIASPNLSDEDIDAINTGYKAREAVIKEALLTSLSDPKNIEDADRLNLLANLIASGVLDIKIAFTDSFSKIGIYHEKVGILTDTNGNQVAFSGSMNESRNAMLNNYETIDVFRSWSDPENRVPLKVAGFDSIWNDREPGVRVFSFPDLDEEIIRKYKRGEPNYDLEKEYSCHVITENIKKVSKNIFPAMPSALELRKYQEKAIDSWVSNGYRGIFDMATGTGKTKTGLGALVRLSQALNHKLAVVIVCPFQHLVEQWAEEIIAFNINPIIGYSDSPQKDWYKALKRVVRDQRYGVEEVGFFCFLCTNGTFATEKVQEQLKRITSRKLLIVDEAHNFGAEYLRSLLDESFDYRLALSATIERHGDKAGTEYLFEYFGDRCIKYSLEEAIFGRDGEESRLTQYKYYPITVTLEHDELERYSVLSRQISRCIIKKNGNRVLSERGKKLALKRARIVAGAKGKINALLHEIEPYKNDNFILVYCGATRVVDSNLYNEDDSDDERQIEVVKRALGNEMHMVIHQFTARESRKDREEIKRQFANGRGFQALVAIKCLDEGVDIPSIKTAFILASTTNPREYIQRRGRLLRKAEGKEFAEIYDFVTLPRKLGEVASLTHEETVGDRRLVYNELVRAKEFARLAMNSATASKLLSEIEESYFGVNGIEGFTRLEDYSE